MLMLSLLFIEGHCSLLNEEVKIANGGFCVEFFDKFLAVFLPALLIEDSNYVELGFGEGYVLSLLAIYKFGYEETSFCFNDAGALAER